MNGKPYMSRLCDADLQLALQSSGAVLIEGAKYSIKWQELLWDDRTVNQVSKKAMEYRNKITRPTPNQD
jgi:hypothetical protein